MNEQTKLISDLILVQSRIDQTMTTKFKAVTNITVVTALLYVLWLVFGDVEIMAIAYATIMMAARLSQGFFKGLYHPLLVTAIHHIVLAVGMFWIITGFFYIV